MQEPESSDDDKRSPDENSRRFERAVESESEKDGAASYRQTAPKMCHSDFLDSLCVRICGDVSMRYNDFDVKNKDYHVFRASEWSWDENGYETARHLFPDAAGLFDAEFEYILSMTDHTINLVDTGTTAPFRHAVWYYTHRLYGILHDDYNYALLNKLLPRRLKLFIKNAVCNPESCDPSALDDIDLDLQPHEQVHVVLLAIEARKMAELLFGLRAIAEFTIS